MGSLHCRDLYVNSLQCHISINTYYFIDDKRSENVTFEESFAMVDKKVKTV
jgi:hypothetical protein